MATGLAAAAATLPGFSQPRENITVQEVINRILLHIPGGVLPDTVDTLKSGDATKPVRGIVTTMFATVDVIRQAVERGADFIIVHEPAFYNHADETDWLEDDKVYRMKRRLIEDHGVAIWRFHDYWHRHDPDGILKGVLMQLDWEPYYNPESPAVLTLPRTTLGAVVRHVKDKLGIGSARVIGELGMPCARIGLMPGAWGGRRQLALLKQAEPDVLICGEVAEWETSEYIRDARALGMNRALVIPGHIPSEEPGMAWLAEWLRPKFPELAVHHVPAQNPFTIV